METKDGDMLKKWILLGVISVLGAQAFAYTFTLDFEKGRYWNSLPIPFTVHESDPGKKALLEEFTAEAVEIWENVVGRDIWNFEENANFENGIRWADNFADETGHDPVTTLAVTIRYGKDSHFTRTEIILNPESALITTNEEALRTVIIHEIGHTVGLNHSEDAKSVMSAYINLDFDELALDDIEGMNAVIDENITRQENNHVSSEFTQGSNSDPAVGCGTITTGGNGPGPGNTLFSLSLGFLLALGISRLKHSRISIK